MLIEPGQVWETTKGRVGLDSEGNSYFVPTGTKFVIWEPPEPLFKYGYYKVWIEGAVRYMLKSWIEDNCILIGQY